MALKYTAYAEEITWFQARDKCVTLGGQLAVVRSAEDQAALEAVLNAGGLEWSRRKFFLGGHDSWDEATFRWTDQSYVSYTNWGTNEPSQQAGARGNKDCIIAVGNDAWKWHDTGCDWAWTGFVKLLAKKAR